MTATGDGHRPRWVKVLDQTRCVGCHACTTACKSENDVPLGVTRTYVKSVDVGLFPQVYRAFQVTRCNMCEDAPCVEACPTSAMYQRADGLVDFDKRICIGCKACIAACPYDAIFINPEDHSAEKCNFCSHRLEIGLEPACVVVCPVEAILVGDVTDPTSRVAQLVHRLPVAVRRPEKETRPKVFYRGAHQATLDPIAARRPVGGRYMWSEQGQGPRHVASGAPAGWANSSAAAMVSYDIPHKAPWGWKVGLYTWTKGIAAGAYLVAVALALAGEVDWGGDLVRWVAPLLSLVFLGVTGAILVADLTHPGRFLLIFLRAQWRSWLVKGAFILTGYGAALGVHLAASVTGSPALARVVAVAGIPLGVMAAVYTAYLFAQAKARDLWQSPLLPPHLLVQAVLAGAATLLLASPLVEAEAGDGLALLLAAACVAHLLFVAGETTLTHGTAHAHLAVWELTRGSASPPFRAGLALVAVGVAAPLVGLAVAPFALAGLLAHEHAYVKAAQAVPLA